MFRLKCPADTANMGVMLRLHNIFVGNAAMQKVHGSGAAVRPGLRAILRMALAHATDVLTPRGTP